MKTWEKLQKLDSEYQKLRQQILLGQVEDFDIRVTLNNNTQAALLKPAKKPKLTANATK